MKTQLQLELIAEASSCWTTDTSKRFIRDLPR